MLERDRTNALDGEDSRAREPATWHATLAAAVAIQDLVAPALEHRTSAASRRVRPDSGHRVPIATATAPQRSVKKRWIYWEILATQEVSIWNQLDAWLRQIEALRRAA